ncbi:MAG: hypothetical protein LW719_15115 [Comamonadaceae bacterium]|jgi:hypothetical protein|nr:hypothetical protein [Comamonadaceae bacterium]
MTDSSHYGFAKLVPGFDFLQNLAKGTTETLPQMPNLSNWVAPTLDVDELEKRIQELRAVHFWLEQNSKALGATIQALEVQKMTLATLKGMNCSMADLAQAMKLTPKPAAAATGSKPAKPAKAPESAAASMVDPLQWWGSLTQQFQHIASTAMQGVTDAAQAAQAPAAAKRASAPRRSTAKAPAAPTAKTRRKPVRTSGE